MLTATIGVVVLLGWTLEVEQLKRIAPGLAAMKANTALALIAAAVALICLRRGASARSHRAGRALGLLVAVFGLAVLFEYLVADLGFDRLLFSDPAADNPGRPVPHTALAFVLGGLALASVDAPGWRGRAHTLFALAFAAAGFLGTVGYLYGVEYLRAATNRSGIAAPTLLALMLLAAGVLALRPNRGPLAVLSGEDAGARMARWLVPVSLVGSLVLGGLRFLGERAGAFGEQVDAMLSTLIVAAGLLAVVLVTAWHLRRTGAATRRLAAIVEASDDGIFGADRELRISSWNRAAELLFGRPAEQAVGRPVADLIPSDRLGELPAVTSRIAAAETVRGWETEGLRSDGSTVPIELTVSPLRDERGRVSGGATIVRDIRERREAERHFQSLLEAAPDAFVICDADGKIVLVNEQVESYFGYRREEVIGQPVELLVPERIRSSHGAWREVYAGDPRRRSMGSEVELCGRRRDGTEFPVEISLSPLETEQGLQVIAAIRDVTRRRETERALAHSEERFRRSFQDSGVGMALVPIVGDGLGPAFEFNRVFSEITGYSSAELREVPPTELVEKADLPEALEDVRALLEDRVPSARREVRIRTASGALVWASVTGSVVHEADGSPAYLVVQVQDIGERKTFEAQLQYLADHDGLTGLFNRRRFEEELERELNSAARFGTGGVVAVLDLDHFKIVNDTLGHAAGDELIATIGSLLRDRLRASDVLGRMGGDEFALILPRLDVAQALVLCEQLLADIRDDRRAARIATSTRVTASAGVAPYGGTATSAGDVLAEADIAMYDAKEAGRDRALRFDPGSRRHERTRQRLHLLEQVERALEEDRFVLHAQPIVPLHGDGMRRVELLLRMVGEGGELIPPAEFLHLAERSDLSWRIDRWVIARAVQMLVEQERRGNDVCFDVNLSGSSIGEGSIGELIANEIAARGVDPQRLVFEVTETAAIVNLGRAQEFSRRMRDLGCGFALDDFGAGFASFYYLKHLPFDFLKIDGEFIRALPSSRTDQLVVRSMVEIARGLGKQTIAEFVGNEKTVELLRSYGVDFGQGNHLGKPAPLEEAFNSARSATLPW